MWGGNLPLANQDRDFLKEKGLTLQAIYDPIVKSGPPSCLLHKVAIIVANQSTPQTHSSQKFNKAFLRETNG